MLRRHRFETPDQRIMRLTAELLARPNTQVFADLSNKRFTLTDSLGTNEHLTFSGYAKREF